MNDITLNLSRTDELQGYLSSLVDEDQQCHVIRQLLQHLFHEKSLLALGLSTEQGVVAIINALPSNIKVFALLGQFIFNKTLFKCDEICACFRSRVIETGILFGENVKFAPTFLQYMGFHRSTDADVNHRLFQAFILPWLKASAQHQAFDTVMMFEAYSYTHFTKQTETYEHFGYCYAQWQASLEAIGPALRTQWQSDLSIVQKPQALSGHVSAQETIAFFLHTSEILAHVEVLLSLLDSLMISPKPDEAPYRYVLYVLDRKGEALDKRLEGYPVTVRYFDRCEIPDYCLTRRFWEISQAIQGDRTTLLIWVSIPIYMLTLFSARLAPIQVWWSMKYHNLSSPVIDGYLANGMGALTCPKLSGEGKPWHTIIPVLKDLYIEGYAEKAKALRASLLRGRAGTVLGCLGREEKMSLEYLYCVIHILNTIPDAIFIWSGRSESDRIRAVFHQEGVYERVHFVGWVDTKLYSQVIDIYLDTFPFGGGHTVTQAMAAQKAVVYLKTVETMDTGMPMQVMPMLEGDIADAEVVDHVRTLFNYGSNGNDGSNGDSLFLCMNSVEDYIERVLRLYEDSTYYERVAFAGKIFVDRYFSDRQAMSHSFLKAMNHLKGG